MTDLGRHLEKALHHVTATLLMLTLRVTLLWAFKSIPQVCSARWTSGLSRCAV
jgi:hypothetical protein